MGGRAAVPQFLWGLYERGHCQARFLWRFLAFALSFVRPLPQAFFRPDLDFGRRRAQKLSRSAVAPSLRHTSTFPDRALTASSTAADWMITGRKSARLSSLVFWFFARLD
jgi:hypothetical protein